MKNRISEKLYLENLGYNKTKVPDFIFSALVEEANTIKRKNIDTDEGNYGMYANPVLSGHIEKCFFIHNPLESFRPWIINMATEFLKDWDYQHSIKNPMPLRPWMNFQKKHEYNSLHSHRAIFSYVIFIKIPYKYEKERKMALAKDSSYSKSTATFCFHHTNIIGKVMNQGIEVEEGDIIMFPSQLAHSVNPFFTSDDYRITMAGDIINIQ